MSSRPFRKCGVVPLATHTHIYKKGDTVDIEEIGAFQKGIFLPKCHHDKTGRVYNVPQQAAGIVNKLVKDKILPMNQCVY